MFHRMDSERFRIGPMVDSRLFRCPSCPFEGGEDAMIEHAMNYGHIAQAVNPDDRRQGDRRQVVEK